MSSLAVVHEKAGCFYDCYERKAEHFQAFANLGCALLTYSRLTKHSHLG